MTTYNHPFLASIFIYIKLRCSFHEHKVEIMSAHLLSCRITECSCSWPTSSCSQSSPVLNGAFIYCGPGLWNKLPTDLRSIITVDIYLKTDSKPFYSPRLTQ